MACWVQGQALVAVQCRICIYVQSTGALPRDCCSSHEAVIRVHSLLRMPTVSIVGFLQRQSDLVQFCDHNEQAKVARVLLSMGFWCSESAGEPTILAETAGCSDIVLVHMQ